MFPPVIILDFDGTLVESVGIKDRAFERLFSDHPDRLAEIMEYHLSHNAVIRFEKFRHITEEILGEPYDDAAKDRLCGEFSRLVADEIAEAPDVEGAREFLDEAAKHSRMYLLSISPADELAGILKARGLDGRFVEVMAHPLVKSEAITEILRREGVGPGDALMIGDTPEDLEAARASGVAFVGRESGKDLASYGAVAFGDMKQVLDYVQDGTPAGERAPAASGAASPMARCPGCGEAFEAAETAPYPGRDKHQAAPNEIAFCSACGLGVCVPMPSDEDMERLYAEGGYWAADNVSASPSRFPVLYAMALARWRYAREVVKDLSPASILDIGAGHGFFGQCAARELGASLKRYTAVEKDPALGEGLRAEWAKAGHAAALEVAGDLAEAQGPFDLVVLSQVLEHFSDPLAVLRSALELTGPGGAVLVDVPWRDERFKADVFPHLLFFDPGSLAGLAGRAGLEVLDVRGVGRDSARTPLDERNRTLLGAVSDKVVRKSAGALPVSLAAAFYDRRFGASRCGTDGTWVRLLARRRA